MLYSAYWLDVVFFVPGRKLLPTGAPSNGELASAAAQDGVAALERESGRNPTLSRILLALQSVALTAVWQVCS